MKKIIFLSSTALMIGLGACNNSSADKSGTDSAKFSRIDTSKLSAGTPFYQCTMDPEVTSDKPGSCWKCGMDLVKVEKK